jgi:hypothetical protein
LAFRRIDLLVKPFLIFPLLKRGLPPLKKNKKNDFDRQVGSSAGTPPPTNNRPVSGGIGLLVDKNENKLSTIN